MSFHRNISSLILQMSIEYLQCVDVAIQEGSTPVSETKISALTELGF